MPRTSWQDLLDDGPAAQPSTAAGGTPSIPAGVPRSLDDIPELEGLLAERRRLEDTLRQMTGAGGGSTSPEQTRDARRFPMEEPTRESRLALRRADRLEELERDEERRALEVESRDARRAKRQDEPAARRRQAGDDRVARAARAWERHGSRLLADRDLLRDQARAGRGLPLGEGGLSERTAPVRSALDRLDGALASVDRLSRRGGSQERASELGRFRELARDARRWLEDPLRASEAGRRLGRLREQLEPPRGPDPTSDRDVEAFDLRRLRALEALRERREEREPDQPRSQSSRDRDD